MRLVLYEDKAALSPLTANSLTVCQTTRTIRVKKDYNFLMLFRTQPFLAIKIKNTALLNTDPPLTRIREIKKQIKTFFFNFG
jgi:hypothetical protein